MPAGPGCIPLEVPGFQAHDLEVWRVDLDASREPPDAAVAVLDADERTRLGRFLQLGDRARFACVRAALRGRLGTRLGIDARAVPIRIDPRGKPALPGDALRFSIAHSGDHGLVAIGAGASVGVDLERARDLGRLDALADLILSDAERPVWLSERPERRHGLFLRAWTAKEALLKAVGSGLLTDPRAVTVLDEGGALRVRGPGLDSGNAFVGVLPAPAGYAAAFAVLAGLER